MCIRDRAYVDAILTICRREGAGALMVLTDAEVAVVTGFRDEFARENVILCLPSAETIALCRDKNAFARFWEQRNIGNTIPTMRPVSYTHLDVYKRQVHTGGGEAKD